MITTLINNLIISIISTVFIEYMVIKVFFLKKERIIHSVILANLLTNPIIVYIYNVAFIIGISINIIFILIVLLEIVAIFIESCVYKKMLILENRKNIIISMVANLVAVILGIIIL